MKFKSKNKTLKKLQFGENIKSKSKSKTLKNFQFGGSQR
jgi:hypothetical protein